MRKAAPSSAKPAILVRAKSRSVPPSAPASMKPAVLHTNIAMAAMTLTGVDCWCLLSFFIVVIFEICYFLLSLRVTETCNAFLSVIV